jgi:GH25 family lysozyme M1 (1,4-beta-N-acetylmuramidase)
MVLLVADAQCQYQSGLDVPRLAAEGYAALIVKASQGATGYTAPSKFDSWIRQARECGLVPGAYHWLTSSSASSQLDHFLSRLAEVGGPHGLICAVDVEDKDNPPSWETLRAFVTGWYARTGGQPILIYSGKWWWDSRGWDASGLSPYLWDSHYVSGSGYGSALYGSVPDSWWAGRYGCWTQATMLQFTSSGSAGGIINNIDVSAFRGTLGDLQVLAGMAPQQLQEEPMAFLYKLRNTGDIWLYDGGTRRHLFPDECQQILAIHAQMGLWNGGEVLELDFHVGAPVQSGRTLYRVDSAPTQEERDEIWVTDGVIRFHIPDPATLDTIRAMGAAGLISLADGGAVQPVDCHVGTPAGQPVSVDGQSLAEALATDLTTALTGPVSALTETVGQAVAAVAAAGGHLAEAGASLAAATSR